MKIGRFFRPSTTTSREARTFSQMGIERLNESHALPSQPRSTVDAHDV